MQIPEPHHIYLFGPYSYDDNYGFLFVQSTGERVGLRRKPQALLKLLLEAASEDPQRFVTRDEIRRALWPDVEPGADDEPKDQAIDAHITALRKALETANGTSGGGIDVNYILNERGRGYRLAISVTEEGQQVTLAVLPFRVSGSSEDLPATEHGDFEFEVRETLIRRLASNPEIRVSEVSEYLLEQNYDPSAWGRRLGVQKVITGAIFVHNDQVRVTTRLVNTSGVNEPPPEPVEVDLDDRIEAVEIIATHFETALRVPLTGQQKEELARRETKSKDAERLYTQGRVAWARHVGEGIKLAIENFEAAIKLDPEFVLPYIGLADAYFNLGSFGNEVMPPHKVMKIAEQHARRALKLDPTSVEALVSLGNIYAVYYWDFAKAERQYKRAFRIDPKHAHAHHFYALSLAAAARFDDALEEIKLAKDLSPGELKINASAAWIHYFAGRYEEAVEQSLQTLGMAPWYILGHVFLIYPLLQLRQLSEAIIRLRGMLENFKDVPALISMLGYAHALNGDKKEAEQLIQALQELSARRYFSPYNEAVIHLALGRVDEGIRLLEKSFDERSSWLIYLHVEPILAAVREDNRFHGLVEKVGFKKQAAASAD